LYIRESSAVKRLETHSRCVIYLNVITTTEDKTEDKKVSMMIQNMQSISSLSTILKILFEDFSLEVSRDYTFRSTTENESLHKISNDNVARIAIFTIS
jgi:hypothetical protein